MARPPCGCDTVHTHRLTCPMVHPRATVYVRPEITMVGDEPFLRVGAVDVHLLDAGEVRRLMAECRAALDEMGD